MEADPPTVPTKERSDHTRNDEKLTQVQPVGNLEQVAIYMRVFPVTSTLDLQQE